MGCCLPCLGEVWFFLTPKPWRRGEREPKAERQHSKDDDSVYGARGRVEISPSYPGELPARPVLPHYFPFPFPASFLFLIRLFALALHTPYIHRVRESKQQQ